MNKVYSALYDIENKLKTIDDCIYKIYLILKDFDTSEDNYNTTTEHPAYHSPLKKIRIQLETISLEWTELFLQKQQLESLSPSGYPEYPYKRIEENGYVRLYKNPLDKFYSDTRHEHRYVMDKFIGRKLEREELVHHIDGNKQNNSLSNLKIISSREHHKIHRKKRK